MDLTLSFRARATTTGLDRIVGVLRAPFAGPRGRDVVAAMRDSVQAEFVHAEWRTPGGQRKPWPKTKPFGDKPAGETLGGPSGRLARAWAGGPGGYSIQTSDRVAIGMQHPGAAMHRGGSGTEARERITVIRPRKTGARGLPAMFWFLGLVKGAWISPKRLALGLRVPSRPHATSNPVLVRKVADIVQAALLRGAA